MREVLSLGKAFASFGFAFGVHPVLPTVYQSMRHPSSYQRMIVCAFASVLVFYLPIGCVGYATYGQVRATPLSIARPRLAPTPNRHLHLYHKPHSSTPTLTLTPILIPSLIPSLTLALTDPPVSQAVQSPVYETPQLVRTVAAKV